MEKELYIKNISVSQLGTLHRDEGQWVQNYLLGEYDNTANPAMAVGTIAHKFVEILLRTKGDENKALKGAYECIYRYNNIDYIIDTGRMDKDLKQMKPEEILSNFGTKKIDFGKTGSMKKILKDIKGAIDGYLSEKIFYGDVVGLEQSMEFEITEQILDHKFELPIPMKAIADQVCRLTEDRQIVTPEKEVVTIPAGSLYIEDTKFKKMYSDISMDDPKYFFQAMFLYYTSKKQYGEAPAFINFREIKTSKNRDGSSAHQLVTFIYSGEDFEMNKTYFWRFLLASIEKMKFIQENDVTYNCFDFINGSKAWIKQRAFYMQIPADQLKTRMSISNRSKESGNNFSGHSFNLLDKGKEIKEGDVVTGEIEVEDIVRTKLLEFGLPIQYEKTNEGYACNQMLFTPGRGIRMNDILNKTKELELATGIEGIRVEAPVANTTFIGIEYPRINRNYLPLSKYKPKKRGLKIPIGKTINGELIEIDLKDSENPHMLVAGATGSGKSEYFKVAVKSLKGKGDIILIDPKRIGLVKLKKDAKQYLTTETEIYEYLQYILAYMHKTNEMLAIGEYENIYEFNSDRKNKNKIIEKFLFIDEIASLVGAYGKETMAMIGQIVNLGRATGIHFIGATQRPDIKVIPGNIKANIGTRICFQLATLTDSKVVLDEAGAEKLLGKGDMLFKHNGKIKRLQSFYVPKD